MSVDNNKVNTNKIVNATTIRSEGIVILERNNSAKLWANLNAIPNASTHPIRDNASRTKPLIRLNNADTAMIAGII